MRPCDVDVRPIRLVLCPVTLDKPDVSATEEGKNVKVTDACILSLLVLPLSVLL